VNFSVVLVLTINYKHLYGHDWQTSGHKLLTRTSHGASLALNYSYVNTCHTFQLRHNR